MTLGQPNGAAAISIDVVQPYIQTSGGDQYTKYARTTMARDKSRSSYSIRGLNKGQPSSRVIKNKSQASSNNYKRGANTRQGDLLSNDLMVKSIKMFEFPLTPSNGRMNSPHMSNNTQMQRFKEREPEQVDSYRTVVFNNQVNKVSKRHKRAPPEIASPTYNNMLNMLKSLDKGHKKGKSIGAAR